MLNQRFGLYQIRFLKFGFLLTYHASEEEVWTPQESLIFFFLCFHNCIPASDRLDTFVDILRPVLTVYDFK